MLDYRLLDQRLLELFHNITVYIPYYLSKIAQILDSETYLAPSLFK